MAAPIASGRRVLAIGLDGFDIALGERLMAEGRLPFLDGFARRAARFRLDHGPARYTGLSYEHFATGRAPEDYGRWSAVSFDRATYSVSQTPTATRPVFAGIPRRTVVFDAPYFDLAGATDLSGLGNWGAHDPGVPRFSRPAGLKEEVLARFGDYPAPEWIYGFTWPSAERTRAAGAALTRAVEQRADIAAWLLGERLADWELAIVIVAEPHSAIEPFWHGLDAGHPLHGLPSGAAAAEALTAVLAATDRLVERLAALAPDAEIVLFNLHGMGANAADLPAMALVPELFYRAAFGKPYMRTATWPQRRGDGLPLLGEAETWDRALERLVPWPGDGPMARLRRRLARRTTKAAGQRPGEAAAGNLGWMPTARYAAFWPQMPAFVLPSFYDARIRINLSGREAAGTVPAAGYDAAVAAAGALLEACIDPIGGGKVVAGLYPAGKPAHDISASEADLTVTFTPGISGLLHPQHGTIGPLPLRRTGGHTGAYGFLHAAGPGVRPGDYGVTSSFDVVPTLFALLGLPVPPGISGSELTGRFAADG